MLQTRLDSRKRWNALCTEQGISTGYIPHINWPYSLPRYRRLVRKMRRASCPPERNYTGWANCKLVNARDDLLISQRTRYWAVGAHSERCFEQAPVLITSQGWLEGNRGRGFVRTSGSFPVLREEGETQKHKIQTEYSCDSTRRRIHNTSGLMWRQSWLRWVKLWTTYDELFLCKEGDETTWFYLNWLQ